MTSAAAPEVRGADWMVPPASSTFEGLPLKLVQPEKDGARLARREAQVARGHEVDGAAGLAVAAGAERADVVVQPAGRGEVAGSRVVHLRVGAEGRGAAYGDDVRVRRR